MWMMARNGVKAAPRSPRSSSSIASCSSHPGGASDARSRGAIRSRELQASSTSHETVASVHRRIPSEVNVIQLRQLSESASEPLTPRGHIDLSPSHALFILHRLAAHVCADDHLASELPGCTSVDNLIGGVEGGTIIDRTNTCLRLVGSRDAEA
jgi:hypothetical protein